MIFLGIWFEDWSKETLRSDAGLGNVVVDIFALEVKHNLSVLFCGCQPLGKFGDCPDGEVGFGQLQSKSGSISKVARDIIFMKLK